MLWREGFEFGSRRHKIPCSLVDTQSTIATSVAPSILQRIIAKSHYYEGKSN